MVHEITIIPSRGGLDVSKKLLDRFAHFSGRNIHTTVNTNLSGVVLVDIEIDESGVDQDSILNDFTFLVSDVISEHIFNDCLDEILKTKVLAKCREINLDDKESVLEEARNIFFRGKLPCGNLDYSGLRNYGRKCRLTKKVMDFLKTYDSINTMGFATFLTDERSEIDFSVDVAIGIEKELQEYKEYVNLIKYFINTSTSEYKEVHVNTERALRTLTDQDGKDLGEIIIERIEGWYDSIADIPLHDLLAIIFTRIQPKKIIVHGEKPEQSKEMDIVLNAFGDMVTFTK